MKLVIVLILILIFIYIIQKNYNFIKKQSIQTNFTDLLNNLDTGDIITTCKTRTNFSDLIPTVINVYFIHVMIVLNINSKKYFLHCVKETYIPSGKKLFNNSNIQLISCEDFFKNYQKFEPSYKLFKYKQKLDPYIVLKICKKYEKIKYCAVNSFYNDNDLYLSCSLFLAKILNDLGIINKKYLSSFYFPNFLEHKLKKSRNYRYFGKFKF